MRLPIRCLAFTALVASALAADAPTPSTQWTTAPQLSGKLGASVQLFNGKDIDNWTYVPNKPKEGGEVFPKEEAWTVKDGVLHSAGKETKGFNTSYLRENTPYTNYVLTVEQRHVTKGGGGILVAIQGEDKVWPKNLQIQGSVGGVGDFVDQYGIKMTPDPSRTKVRGTDVVTAKITKKPVEKPMGEWDTVQVFVDHGNVWVTVNGELENVATNSEPLTGYIGFQAEGAQMEFRKVEIQPIEESK
ncbi:MAG: 3-keto-disaccharide hydrolase [Phycisphaerae bacterium]